MLREEGEAEEGGGGGGGGGLGGLDAHPPFQHSDPRTPDHHPPTSSSSSTKPNTAPTPTPTPPATPPPNPPSPPPPPPPPPPREFSLHISPSTQNHAAYIARQHYHGRFHRDTRSALGQDLADRVPVAGYADLRLGVGEVPLRVRNRALEEARRAGRGAFWRGPWAEGAEGRKGVRDGGDGDGDGDGKGGARVV